MMVSAVRESRFPVGSSARISWGLFASALAMATRCCSPPLSLPGLRDCLLPVSSTWSSSSSRALSAFLLAAPGEFHREHDVLGGGEVWYEVVALKDESDCVCPVAVELAAGEPGDVLAIDLDAAARGLLETSEQAHEGALSAPAAPDDRDELAVADAHRHILDGCYGAVPGAERLRNVPCFKHVVTRSLGLLPAGFC